MSKTTLQDFLMNRGLVAMKLASGDLAGLFKKRFTIPKDCAGLALFADGAVSLFTEGREVAGKFDLILAKLGDIQIRHPLADLRSSDGFPVQCTIGFSVSVQTERADLFKDFTRSFFNFPGAYASTDLKTALMPEIKKIVADFVAAQKAEDIHKRDRFRDVEGLMRSGLERCLFGTGVRLMKVTEIHFSAPEFADRAAAEAKKQDDERRRAEKVERKEGQLKRLAELLNDSTIKEVLAKLPDERLKGLFYAKLMEDESSALTPQEIAAKIAEGGDNLGELVYKAMEGLLAGPGAAVDASDIPPETAETLFVALGAKVLVFDPAKPDEKPREYQFRDPLRSVRCIESPEGPVLLVGAKRSVHAVTLADGNCLEYPLPEGRQPKGGVNAVAAWGDHVYATHSEYGLVRWVRQKPATPGEVLWSDLTARFKTTRAVQTAGDRLLFASGDRVFAHHLGNGSTKPTEYTSGLDSAVTSLAAGGNRLFAGTESGSIVSWQLGEPGSTLLVRRREPIVNLRLAKICSIPHLFYSTKDVSVRARVIGQNLETSYESGGTSVGVLDAASDLVAASDAAGRRVLLWKSTSPAKPAHDLDVARYSDKPILDIFMKKTKAATK